jgi:hypothetical protein
MSLRRTVAVAAALVGALAPSATAGGTVSLDGAKKSHHVYHGQLGGSALGGGTVGSVRPERAACNAGTCDVTTFRLSLPGSSRVGRFNVRLDVTRSLDAVVALYDAEGTEVEAADVTEADQQPIQCCEEIGTGYQLHFEVPRLPAGTYELVVFDRAGTGGFDATVDYTARPPERRVSHR